MRDGDGFFDDCHGWTEASFIRRLSELPIRAAAMSGRRTTARRCGDLVSTTRIFDLATHGKVADLQRVIMGEGGRANVLARAMPELFSTVGLLEESWKNREITFGEAIRGLFAIREVVKTLENGHSMAAGSMNFFGSGLIGVAEGEQHDFGAQIVAEKLFVSGWRTEVDVKGGLRWLIERARQDHYHFVGISIGTDEALGGLADRIAELRETALNRSIDVILGGAVFVYSTSAFEFLGADYIATTADDAIQFLNARLQITGASLGH